MAGGLQGGNDEVIAHINITPFVDIVLVLLIVFMVTSTYIARAAIDVELPRAASGGERVESTLNLVLTKDGTLLLNGNESTQAAVGEFIRREDGDKGALQAVIAADKGVAYGRVVDVIDLVKQGGIKKFALNIEREVARTAPSQPR